MKNEELRLNTNPSITDLYAIKEWLKDEYERTGEGFYANWKGIEEDFNNDNLVILSYLNSPIGFVAFFRFEIYVEILLFAIEPKFRNRGFGKILYQKIAEHFRRENYVALKLFCKPEESEAFWKKMDFIEYPDIGYCEHSLTYYKPLIEIEKPTTNKNLNNRLELWDCEPYQKKDRQPAWIWDLDSDNNSTTLPIVLPCNNNWNIRCIKNGEIQKEGNVKSFESKEKIIHFPPFLYISSIEMI